MVQRSLSGQPERWIFGLLLGWSLLLCSHTLQAATPGELLQKGIYAEETVGNLDDAVRLYEQVIELAKEPTAAAAEAQYRLAVCLEKQDKRDRATQVFRALVESTPDDSPWNQKAQQHLMAKFPLQPVPWANGDQHTFQMELASGIPVGTMIYRVERSTDGERPSWRCSTRSYTSINNSNGFSEVFCHVDSFAPAHSMWMHTLLGKAEATYGDQKVTIQSANKTGSSELRKEGTIWDNEQAAQLFRRLPLEVGYKEEIVVLSSLGGGKVPITVEVREKQKIEVPAGTFDCFKLVLSVGQTFWISDDAQRHLVQFEASGILAKLTSIEALPDRAQTETAQNETANVEAKLSDEVQVTLPSNWHTYVPRHASEDPMTHAYLLDERGHVTAELKWGARSSLKPEFRESVRAWSEGFIKEMKSKVPDFQVDPQDVKEIQIGSLAACTLTAQRTENGQKVMMHGVAVLDGERALTIRFTTPADRYAQEQEMIQRIVQSLRFH